MPSPAFSAKRIRKFFVGLEKPNLLPIVVLQNYPNPSLHTPHLTLARLTQRNRIARTVSPHIKARFQKTDKPFYIVRAKRRTDRNKGKGRIRHDDMHGIVPVKLTDNA